MTPKQYKQANVVYNLRGLGYTINKPSSIKIIANIIKQYTEDDTVCNGSRKYKAIITKYNNSITKVKPILLKNILLEMKCKPITNKVQAIQKPPRSHYKNTSKFYMSFEYRQLRYEVLAEQSGTCQLCGRTRKDGCIMHLDHIVPISKDWSRRLDKSNMQVLCEDCNLGKSNLDDTDWR